MTKIFILSAIYCLLSTIYCLLTPPVFAGNYVLPYPSFMPGNKIYKVSRIIDKLQNYWHWGNVSQMRYHLGLADKYLVEAKTLFEYDQYLLGVDALKRSNSEYQNIKPYIVKAKSSGMDTQSLREVFESAEEKHEEVLVGLKGTLPENFIWTPEKVAPTTLPLHQLLEEAVTIRKNELVGL